MSDKYLIKAKEGSVKNRIRKGRGNASGKELVNLVVVTKVKNLVQVTVNVQVLKVVKCHSISVFKRDEV